VLQRQQASEKLLVSLIDRNGVIINRSPRPGESVGQPATAGSPTESPRSAVQDTGVSQAGARNGSRVTRPPADHR
jgi:hypothetical protein